MMYFLDYLCSFCRGMDMRSLFYVVMWMLLDCAGLVVLGVDVEFLLVSSVGVLIDVYSVVCDLLRGEGRA